MSDRRHCALLAFVLAATSLAGCRPADRAGEVDEASDEAASSSGSAVVEVIAADYAFQAPAEIPSGWTTFRFRNEGREHHFFTLTRLPADKTLEDYQREVGAPFDTVWDALKTGAADKVQAGEMLGRLLPAWYASAQPMGGAGLVAPGRSVRTTVNLVPGTYVMECYVKTADGTFHASLGMQRPITVTEEASGGTPPDADIDITLTNFEIAVEGALTSGEHNVAVHFVEHPEIGLGNDVHLVRLEDGMSVDEVVPWMDWMNLNGLRAPAPAEFVGGVQEMPVGHTGYFSVDLEPGRYAWISESAAAQGMVKEFTVE
jgi:hypothetical protein